MPCENERALVERLDACLPQTQCTRCGYPHCRAYAEAMARGEADINRCPPGAEVTIERLAQVLGVSLRPLDPACGPHEPRQLALIDEARCIGCAKCLDACPIDAIVGAHQWMHTVVAAQCSGCELCVAPCPVDCILMVSAPQTAPATPWPEYPQTEVDAWRAKAAARRARLARAGVKHRRAKGGARRRETFAREAPPPQMREEIRAAVERVKRKRAAHAERQPK